MKALRRLSSCLLFGRVWEGSESYDVIKEVSSAHMVNVDIRFIAEGKPFVINILRWLSIILPFN